MENEMAGSELYNIRDENVQLLETVVQYSSLESRKQPETLLLFGLSGSGKTSMVNTIYNELTGLRGSALQAGSGNFQSRTLDFKWYPNCGVQEDSITNSNLKSRIGPIIGNLPNIIDCAGKGDVNDEQAKEILRHTLTGRIPPGTSIAALQSWQDEHDIGCLDDLVDSCDPEWRVTRIIFVQPATEPIPEQLLNMLHDVLSEYDDRFQTKYKASLFTVITKHDLVQDAAGRDLYGSDQDATITAQQFKDKKDELAAALGITNNVGDNCIPWASYCDTVRMPTPKVENSVWKLLEKIQFPKPVERTGVPLSKITLRTRFKLKYRALKKKIRALFTNALCCTYVLIFVIIVMIVAFIGLFYKSHQTKITSSL